MLPLISNVSEFVPVLYMYTRISFSDLYFSILVINILSLSRASPFQTQISTAVTFENGEFVYKLSIYLSTLFQIETESSFATKPFYRSNRNSEGCCCYFILAGNVTD